MRRWLLACCAIIGSVLAAPGAHAQGTIKIGLILPYSGPVADYWTPENIDSQRRRGDGSLRPYAVVGCPQSETAINSAGIAFSGYPPLVADLTGTPRDEVFMMLSAGGLNIAHCTLHEAVSTALARLTPDDPAVHRNLAAIDFRAGRYRYLEFPDLVRNIMVSPLSGRRGGRTNLRSVADDLDHLIRADARLAELPGRFLFVLDDGRGDLHDQKVDLGLVALDAYTAQLRVGAEYGEVVALAAAAERLAALVDQSSGGTAPRPER